MARARTVRFDEDDLRVILRSYCRDNGWMDDEQDIVDLRFHHKKKIGEPYEDACGLCDGKPAPPDAPACVACRGAGKVMRDPESKVKGITIRMK